ncbi:hypothetical protein [Microbacterium sp. CSI-V]|uniref:hypothetical protein n=1 Tax=Microbacterium sp. CSI-V TaxID=1933777 RepID=UPI00158F36AA|nr:hypothetical protein [Microbacterium sp. CSI-V]
MPRGGPRAGAGRTPDTSSLSEAVRIEAGAIRTLPKERTGPVPEWPLSEASERELEVWADMWRKPQAIVWEEQLLFRPVAFHVRTSVKAEDPDSKSAILSVLMRQENELLLNYRVLLSAGLRISTNPVQAPTVSASRPAVAKRQVPSSRGRLKASPDVGADR